MLPCTHKAAHRGPTAPYDTSQMCWCFQQGTDPHTVTAHPALQHLMHTCTFQYLAHAQHQHTGAHQRPHIPARPPAHMVPRCPYCPLPALSHVDGLIRTVLTDTGLCLPGPPACHQKTRMWHLLFERNTNAHMQMHLHPTQLQFSVFSQSLFLCLACHSTSSMPLKHRSRWFAGQFRMMVHFSASGSLQLLRSVLSVSEIKILLAHPHTTPVSLSAPIRSSESKCLFKLPS